MYAGWVGGWLAAESAARTARTAIPCGYLWCEVVYQHFRDVLDDGEPPRHVAVEGRVAHAILALVAGRQHEPAELVGERHQEVAADAGLQVLLGDIFLHALERLAQGALVGVEQRRDRD